MDNYCSCLLINKICVRLSQTQEERQMAAALRTIERMEKREERRRAELKSSEFAVRVRGGDRLTNSLWLNGQRHENDESSTDAASEHVRCILYSNVLLSDQFYSQSRNGFSLIIILYCINFQYGLL